LELFDVLNGDKDVANGKMGEAEQVDVVDVDGVDNVDNVVDVVDVVDLDVDVDVETSASDCWIGSNETIDKA
jgi:hypothetical protein